MVVAEFWGNFIVFPRYFGGFTVFSDPLQPPLQSGVKQIEKNAVTRKKFQKVTYQILFHIFNFTKHIHDFFQCLSCQKNNEEWLETFAARNFHTSWRFWPKSLKIYFMKFIKNHKFMEVHSDEISKNIESNIHLIKWWYSSSHLILYDTNSQISIPANFPFWPILCNVSFVMI